MPTFLKLVISLAIPFIAAFIGSLATTSSIPDWYAALEKPFFNPPNWLFGPVWTVLYLLMGMSLYLVWSSSVQQSKRPAFSWFGIQLVFNTLWSIVFFGLHAPELALVVILALIGSIAVTMRRFWPFSRMASYLLVPYILWVIFASALNLSIAILN